MARELDFTPLPTPARKIERTCMIQIFTPNQGDVLIRAQREILSLDAEGKVLSSEPALTVERWLSKLADDPESMALAHGVADKIDEWAEADAAVPPETFDQPQGIPDESNNG